MRLSNRSRNHRSYAFIDAQNLNFGTSKDVIRGNRLVYSGWKLDMKKFRVYLWDKFRISRAYLFLGYIPKYKRMYETFESYDYEIIFKPTVTDINGKAKGNVDAELVLHSACIQYDKFDSAVVVSGDGDFLCLYEFLSEQGKLSRILIPNKWVESSLLKKFQNKKVFIDNSRKNLEYKKDGGRMHISRRNTVVSS